MLYKRVRTGRTKVDRKSIDRVEAALWAASAFIVVGRSAQPVLSPDAAPPNGRTSRGMSRSLTMTYHPLAAQSTA